MLHVLFSCGGGLERLLAIWTLFGHFCFSVAVPGLLVTVQEERCLAHHLTLVAGCLGFWRLTLREACRVDLLQGVVDFRGKLVLHIKVERSSVLFLQTQGL